MYYYRLTSKYFGDSDAMCTGEQLCELVHSINENLQTHVWFVADVTTAPATSLSKYGSQKPSFLGATDRLTNYCERVDQFHSGVFLAIDVTFNHDNLPDEVDTEDEVGRPRGKSTMEIRAFDTSYFEVYSNFEIIQFAGFSEELGSLTK